MYSPKLPLLRLLKYSFNKNRSLGVLLELGQFSFLIFSPSYFGCPATVCISYPYIISNLVKN